MQTIEVQVKDEYIQEFMDYIKEHSEEITIIKDGKFECDAFFYQRQKELRDIRDKMKSGDRRVVSFDELEYNIEQFEKELESKYAN